ncbi:MAG: hemolysin family protein [Chloroflexota bacterium]
MVSLILAVGTVIVVSAMCSLFEAVIYAVPLSHIESLVQAKRPNGLILQQLREKVDEPIAAILSLNTIANTAGAAIAGAMAAGVFGSAWLGLFSSLFTLAILLFSEVVPKTVGVVYARSLSERIARPLLYLVWVFKPLIWLLGLATKVIERRESSEKVSEADLVAMTQLGMREGVIKTDEGEVIKNILSLENKTVREVMTPRTVLFTLPDNITVEEAMIDKQLYTHSRIPVYSENIDNIIGIALRHDIVMAVAENRLNTEIASLIKPADFIFERNNLDQVLKKFLELHRHMFVVIGEFGDVKGAITLEDILEEILGQEIVDESDRVVDMRELAKHRRQELLKEHTDSHSKTNDK